MNNNHIIIDDSITYGILWWTTLDSENKQKESKTVYKKRNCYIIYTDD